VVEKLVVLGEGGVGKSALTIQFTQNQFIKDYDPTIENSYRKQITVDGKPSMLDILDTAGQEEYSVMRDQYIRTGMGFLIVYSIANRDSFESMDDFYQQILRVKDTVYPMVLVGNKADLEDQRKVQTWEGEALAKKWGCRFYETSAKTKQNIDTVFEQLVKEMRVRQNKLQELASKDDSATPTSTVKKRLTSQRLAKSKSLRNLLSRKKCIVC